MAQLMSSAIVGVIDFLLGGPRWYVDKMALQIGRSQGTGTPVA